jgi:5'-nucleotidase
MQEDDKIALVDLDGTAADYDKTMKAELDRLRAPGEAPVVDRYMDRENNEVREMPHLEARRKLIQAKPGFWRNLPRHPLGFQVIEELRALKFTLGVLTKGPGKTPGAWTEKFEWCQLNFPDADVTVTQNKERVYGRVLVDDWPAYFIPWQFRRPRGLIVCVAQPWNANMDEIRKQAKEANVENLRIVRYDGTNLAELKEQLHWAYNRPARGV